MIIFVRTIFTIHKLSLVFCRYCKRMIVAGLAALYEPLSVAERPGYVTPDCYDRGAMKKPQIAKRLAKRAGVSRAEAADQLDRVINDIVTQLRSGQAAPLPGLGKFVPGRTWEFQFDKAKGPAK